MWPRSLIVCAGLLGAAGVAIGAAGAHLGGGDLARLSSEFLLVHAAAIPGIVAIGRDKARPIRLAAATVLALGVALFSGDLALLAFGHAGGIAGLAPAGGLSLIVGWLMLAASAAWS